VNGAPVRKMAVIEASTFFFMYILMALVCTFVVSSAGYGIETSLTATLATLGNIGPGMSLVGPVCNYGFLPDYVTWTLSFAMLVGRLELYTVFVLFSSAYRRR
jgi:trk system potassium uptake protein TrkH